MILYEHGKAIDCHSEWLGCMTIFWITAMATWGYILTPWTHNFYFFGCCSCLIDPLFIHSQKPTCSSIGDISIFFNHGAEVFVLLYESLSIYEERDLDVCKTPGHHRFLSWSCTFFVEHQTTHLNTLSPRRILRRRRILKRRMRRPDRQPFSTLLHSLASGIETLQQHDLVRRHILDVVKLVIRARCDCQRLTAGLVALQRGFGAGRGQALFPAVVVGVAQSGVGPDRIHEVDGEEVLG